MRPRSPLIMFLPWIVFSCLPNNQFVTGASIALVLSVVLSWRPFGCNRFMLSPRRTA